MAQPPRKKLARTPMQISELEKVARTLNVSHSKYSTLT